MVAILCRSPQRNFSRTNVDGLSSSATGVAYLRLFVAIVGGPSVAHSFARFSKTGNWSKYMYLGTTPPTYVSQAQAPIPVVADSYWRPAQPACVVTFASC